ncbi:MAG: hypothetical protein ACHRXM_36940 [Isosphaerales bacterium]
MTVVRKYYEASGDFVQDPDREANNEIIVGAPVWLKKRYGAILQEQIAATLDDPAQIDDEIRDLFEAIRPKNRGAL